MSPRQHTFAEYCVLSRNGTQAALRVGYAPTGAHATASRLLRNPKVAAVVAEHEVKAVKELGFTQEKVLQRS